MRIAQLVLLLAACISLILDVSMVLAQSSCEAVYNQSGTYVCLPVAPNVSTSVGSIYVTPINSSFVNVTLVVMGFAPGEKCEATIELMNSSGAVLLKNTTEVEAGDVITMVVELNQSLSYVVVNATICNVSIPPFAVLMPQQKTSGVEIPRELASNPLFALLLAIIPVAPIIGFMLRSNVYVGAIATLASLPAIYVLANYLAPQPYRVPATIVATFIVALTLAIAGRR